MNLLILLLTFGYLAFLAAENVRALRDRRQISHVVYVNGTRGKSTVSRLIDAGLRTGGYRVFCKTTGSLAMTIDVNGGERPIIRHGRANIKEQLRILRRAAKEKAEVLVAECMAVDPALQYLSQHRMVRADLGVITNVRLDHTDEMGATLDEICESLCSTVPQNGVVFTADAVHAAAIGRRAAALGSELVLALPEGEIPGGIDFPENVALALAVCERLGVDRKTALEGMAHYQRDPYALSLFVLPGGALFINGLSINDPDSSERVWRMLAEKNGLFEKRLILLVNNRPDRGYRTEHMLLLAQRLSPDEVWLMGAFRGAATRRLHRLPNPPLIRSFTRAPSLPLADQGADTVIFAAGNIANEGHPLMARVRKEGTPFVP